MWWLEVSGSWGGGRAVVVEGSVVVGGSVVMGGSVE